MSARKTVFRESAACWELGSRSLTSVPHRLNIHTPKKHLPSAKLPVMVWYHNILICRTRSKLTVLAAGSMAVRAVAFLTRNKSLSCSTGGFYAGASHEDRFNPKDLIERSQRMNQPFVFVSIK